MALSSDFRIKVRHFIKNYYKPIIIVITIALIIILINRFLMNKQDLAEPQTTYTPNVPVLGDTKDEVPEKVSNKFEDFIKNYIGYCNNRNYVAAWNMISTDCKENFFGNNYDLYVQYVQQKFDGNTKRYAIQSYSNVDGKYIYDVKIFNDFLATGLTNQKFVTQSEKFIMYVDDKDNLICSVGNYMGKQKLTYMASNDYLRVEVTSAIEKYNFIIYQLNFVNRTNHTIVIKDGLTGDWEVGLAIGSEIRNTLDTSKIVLKPGETKKVQLSFEKFYDSGTEPTGIVFNSVRVMDNYTGNEDTAEAEIANAIDKFSMTVGF